MLPSDKPNSFNDDWFTGDGYVQKAEKLDQRPKKNKKKFPGSWFININGTMCWTISTK